VDVFTDAHPIVLRSKRRIRPPHRRYAPVLVDVFYDHFLAVHWDRYSPVPLPEFTRSVYADLAEWHSRLPEPMAGATRRMAEQDWLGSYAEIDGIREVLQRMSRRLKRENPLAAATEALLAEYEGLEADFFAFFPELAAAVRDEIPHS
jgi:acyl carrier protein phosphodiesterase